MLERPLGQKVACSESGVPGADDYGANAFNNGAPQATSTLTSVGFERASNTAERFCD